MSLQNQLAALPLDQQIRVALHFARLALPIWEKYAATPSQLEYVDSVVGMSHVVDPELLRKSLTAVEHEALPEKINALHKLFLDPVVSLQDWDWELPYAVERIFYAVYNLLKAVMGEEKSMLGESLTYVSVNQAVDALLKAKVLDREGIAAELEKFLPG